MHRGKVSSGSFELCLDVDFVESSALNSSNVETAFIRLINQINNKVEQGYFNDRLEAFNFFGSKVVREKYQADAQNQDGDGNETYQLKAKQDSEQQRINLAENNQEQ